MTAQPAARESYWYDHPDTWNRRKALEFDHATGELWLRRREHPADTWPAPELIASGYTIGQAQQVAAGHGLRSYE